MESGCRLYEGNGSGTIAQGRYRGKLYAMPVTRDSRGFYWNRTVFREAGLNPDILNVNGGAIALGHPLGCTGAKLTATILREMARRNVRYGMVTMCIGGGQGAAGIFERWN